MLNLTIKANEIFQKRKHIATDRWKKKENFLTNEKD